MIGAQTPERRSPQGHRGHRGTARALSCNAVAIAPLLVPVLVLLVACGERRDLADMAAGVAPFKGLREMVGEYDVLYSIPGFDGSDLPCAGAAPGDSAAAVRAP